MKNIIALEKIENLKESIIYIMWAQVGQASRLSIVLMQGISIFPLNTRKLLNPNRFFRVFCK